MKKLIQLIINKSFIASGLCLSIIGCSDSFDTSFFEKEINDPVLNIQANLPIGFTTYTAKELFEEISNDLQVESSDDTGKSVINFSYSKTIETIDNSSFLSIENQSFNGTLNLITSSELKGNSSITYASGIIPGNQLSKTFTEIEEIQKGPENSKTSLDFNLTSADFSSGTVEFVIKSTAESQVDIIFEIPSLKHKITNTTFSQNFVLNNNSGNDFSVATINLNEYDFDLTIDSFDPNTNTPNSSNGVNKIAVKMTATMSFENGDMVTTSDNITYDINVLEPTIKFVEGDFKQKNFDIENQTFNLDFFNELGNGTVQFQNPTLSLKATNSYGFPIGLTLENIAATNGTTTNNLLITDTSASNDNIEPYNTGGASGYYAIINKANTVGSFKASEIILNNTNSNLASLLNSKPNKFNLNVMALSNPNSTTINTNFFDTTSTLNIDVKVNLPLFVSFNKLSFSPDPFDLNLNDIDENAKSLTLRVASRNAIPLTGNITIEFVDENNNIKFTKTATAIKAAPIDANAFSQYRLDNEGVLKQGDVTIAPEIISLEFTESEISDLKDVKQAKVTVIFDTTDTDNDGTPDAVKIQIEDQLRLDLGIKGDLKINLGDDN